jgi:mannosyltransferase OCH1-like enzyme
MNLIPKKIYQSWKTKILPDFLEKNVKITKTLNPDYEYVLYDDEDCKNFLLKNFGINYSNAFEVLIPGAFKCDFWRYAMLYVNGGIYIDMDMIPLLPFDSFIENDDEFLSIVDRDDNGAPGIYQSFIACSPRHPILLYSLQLCFANITTRRYSENQILSVTGPGLMAVAFNLFFENKNTLAKIHPGDYKNGIKLFSADKEHKYTHNLENTKIFTNKTIDYKGENYGQMKLYHNQEEREQKKININIFYLFVFLLIIFFSFYFYINLKKN